MERKKITKLHYYRVINGLTIDDLSEQTGIVRASIAAWDSGKKPICMARTATVMLLAEFFGVRIDDIIEENWKDIYELKREVKSRGGFEANKTRRAREQEEEEE